MKYKVDNFLVGNSDHYDRLIGRLTERFGGTFTLDKMVDNAFDLNWDLCNRPAWERMACVRAFVDGYMSH